MTEQMDDDPVFEFDPKHPDSNSATWEDESDAAGKPAIPGYPDREARPDDRDKDVLRGGSGEKGTPTDPPTNDDLLNQGSGYATDPDAPGTDAAVEGDVGDSTLVPPWEQGEEESPGDRHSSPNDPPPGTELANHTPDAET